MLLVSLIRLFATSNGHVSINVASSFLALRIAGGTRWLPELISAWFALSQTFFIARQHRASNQQGQALAFCSIGL
jgi:hypothetical protein